MDVRQHRERVYRTQRCTEVSWYAPHLDTSPRLIEEAASGRRAAIIDVGGGEAMLVDDPLVGSHHDLSVLDVSATALAIAKARLRACCNAVQWPWGDVTAFAFQMHRCEVWHDRALFHFLTDPKDRAAHVRLVARNVEHGGHVIVATFGREDPTRCSGLDITCFGAGALHHQFGNGFRLLRHLTRIHRTPAGTTQQVTYCYCEILTVPEQPLECPRPQDD